jgi:hypothetical protein
MAEDSLVAAAQLKLEEAQRRLQLAVLNYKISDEAVLKLRDEARRAEEALNEASRASKKSLLGFLKFW